jgi:hypothetical protein
MDAHKTDVIFRVDTRKNWLGNWTYGNVFALFPHEVADNKGNVTSYQHVGQHSSADYNHCIKTSRIATENEYKDLKKELESIGYNLNVIKKQNYQKYLNSYRNI